MNIAARIRAVGAWAGGVDNRKRKVGKVKCEGCGKEIRSDGILEDVEYIKTKRGTELFIHRDCVGEVWKHKIM